MRKKIIKSGRRHSVVVQRPAIPHLHLVDLRKQEGLINRVLFKGNITYDNTPDEVAVP